MSFSKNVGPFGPTLIQIRVKCREQGKYRRDSYRRELSVTTLIPPPHHLTQAEIPPHTLISQGISGGKANVHVIRNT